MGGWVVGEIVGECLPLSESDAIQKRLESCENDPERKNINASGKENII